MASTGHSYKAFISYSHRDEKWATWLHRALESYRLPRNLRGTSTAVGEVPARIKPVFRDRDELSSSADLGSTVQQALKESENLIVVCSPGAAKSHWTNEEIRYFAQLGRADRIFCMIVDGDPAGTDPETACFPPILAEIGMHEPLAADVRRWADGKHLAKLKLVAGMLGLPLDQLRRRDLQKRQKTWTLVAIAMAALVAILIAAVTSRIAAEQRRVSGESLVAFKLNELRTLLDIAADPADLGRLETWDKAELSRLVADAGTGEDALTLHALGLRENGIQAWRAGDLVLAMEQFQDSWALLATAYRRDESDLMVFFEVGQAEYWIGQIYRDLNALGAARDVLTSYAEITRQLIVLQPENAEWVLEMAFALSNLGSLQREIDVNNPEKTLQLLQSSLEYNQIALVLDPTNEYYQSELGQSHAFLADAQLDVCDLEGAYRSREQQIALEREILANDSENINSMRRLAFALSGYAGVQEALGHSRGAMESYAKALQLMEPVLRNNPEVRRRMRFMLNREHRMVMLKVQADSAEQVEQTLDRLEKQWRQFLEVDGVQDETIRLYVTFLLDRAQLAWMSGDKDLTGQLLESAADRVIYLLEKRPGDRGAGNLLMSYVFLAWEAGRVLPPETIMAQLPDYGGNPGQTRACQDASLAARLAVMQGDIETARKLTSYLLDNEYTEVSFMQFCEKYALCEGR